MCKLFSGACCDDSLAHGGKLRKTGCTGSVQRPRSQQQTHEMEDANAGCRSTWRRSGDGQAMSHEWQLTEHTAGHSALQFGEGHNGTRKLKLTQNSFTFDHLGQDLDISPDGKTKYQLAAKNGDCSGLQLQRTKCCGVHYRRILLDAPGS